MKALRLLLAAFLLLYVPLQAAESLVPIGLRTFQLILTAPTSPTDQYTSDVYLKSVWLIPQSTTSPTCTIQDKAGSPNKFYNAVSVTANHTYRDEPVTPVYFLGGLTLSCSDNSVLVILVVQH